MAKLENRFIRIEDWKGNVYYPLSNLEASTAGSISGWPSSDPNSDPYTSGSEENDSLANNGKSIYLNSGSEDRILYKGSFVNVPFGDVAIGIRMKINTKSSDKIPIVGIKFYIKDQSSSSSPEIPLNDELDITEVTKYYDYKINVADFTDSNTYITFANVIDYAPPLSNTEHQMSPPIPVSKKCSLIVEVRVIQNVTVGGIITKVNFDQMYVAPSIGSKAKLNIEVEDRKLKIVSST